MNYLNFAIILAIFGSLLISNGYSAPAESQPKDETTTKMVIEENDSNSTNGTIKTPEQLKEVCESAHNQTKWMNNTCYSFHNVEIRHFDEAQKICSDEFKKYGLNNGRIYEPRNNKTFVKLYKMAEKFSNYPTLQIWIGLHDNEKEGEFRYDSDNQIPTIDIPWGLRQPNGGKRENCATSFIPDSGESPEWFDRPCFENDPNGEPGHRFFCECHIEEEHANEQVSKNSSSKDHLKINETRAMLMAEIKAHDGVSALKSVDDNNSTKTENVSKDERLADNPDLDESSSESSTSTTTQNVVGSNPESNVDMTPATTTDDGANLRLSQEREYDLRTNSENNEISDAKETAQPLVQNDSPIVVPIPDSGRQFDGWSFFGGIILTVGMAAIVFMSAKYYKTRNPTSMNYNLF